MNARNIAADIKNTIKEQGSMDIIEAKFFQTVYGAWDGANYINLTVSVNDDDSVSVYRETLKEGSNTPLDTREVTVTDRISKDKALALIVR